jgi:hypothetical protein
MSKYRFETPTMNSLDRLLATIRDTKIIGMNELINHEMKLTVELRPMIFIVYSIQRLIEAQPQD